MATCGAGIFHLARPEGRIRSTPPVSLKEKIIPGRLTDVTIAPKGNEYLIRFTDEVGARFELVATFEQLDDLAEDIDRQLDADEDREADWRDAI